MKRRQFLQTTAAGTLALTPVHQLFAQASANLPYMADMGLQLYTLRNQLKKDTPGTIKAVADAGYKQVEPFGFPNADEMIAAAKDNGLGVRSSHFAWDAVINPTDKGVPPFSSILEKANTHGLTHLVIPYLADRNRGGADEYKRIAENCKSCGRRGEAGWHSACVSQSFLRIQTARRWQDRLRHFHGRVFARHEIRSRSLLGGRRRSQADERCSRSSMAACRRCT